MPVINRLADFHTEMTAWRQDLHAHPELAFEEHRTAAFVADKLTEFGLEVYRGVGVTGVVGLLRGQGNAPRHLGLRADMDALPLQEANTFAHASKHPGKMHACGHDGHTSMLLGAAKYLAETRNFDGTVAFIFQPAEEGRAGAKVMMDDGLFDRFPCDQVYGVHNWPELPVGEIAVRPGPIMAAADTFDIEIRGHGAHAAMPHHGIDPIVVAAQIVLAAQALISRETSPLDNAVLSITTIHAGTADNIVPSHATLGGTVRTFDAAVRDRLEQRMAALVKSVAAGFGATADFTFHRGYPATVNHAAEADLARQVAAQVVGEERVRTNVAPCMGAEDFSFMLNQRPGAYVWIGQGSGSGDCMVHHPRYDFNDAILPIGASYFAALTERLLPRQS